MRFRLKLKSEANKRNLSKNDPNPKQADSKNVITVDGKEKWN